jgi:hypothetical protein
LERGGPRKLLALDGGGDRGDDFRFAEGFLRTAGSPGGGW